MSYANRDGMSITTALIISNIVVFLINNMVEVPALYGVANPMSPQMEPVLYVRGAYSWFTCFGEGQLWRLISYQFLHANIWHLIFNMWALYFFGYAVEYSMGAHRYLIFYLSCGVAGALFSSLLFGVGVLSTPDVSLLAQYTPLGDLLNAAGLSPEEFWKLVPMVGASAGIYGVLVAVAFLYPHSVVQMLFPPIAMTMRTFALMAMGIAFLTVTFNGNNAGGEAGHLGGIILSAVIMWIWRRRARERGEV